MADNHKHRARIFLHRGDLVQARAAWEAAVADDRTVGSEQALSDSLGNLGNTCALMNDFPRAEQCYREVLQIQRTERNLTAVAHTLVNLGNLLIASDHPEFKQALDHHRTVGNEEGLAVTYSQLGKCYLDQGDLTRAERCLNNASEHYIKLGNEPAEAAVLRLLATVYKTRQDTAAARRCLTRVVALDERYALPEFQADSSHLARLGPSG